MLPLYLILNIVLLLNNGVNSINFLEAPKDDASKAEIPATKHDEIKRNDQKVVPTADGKAAVSNGSRKATLFGAVRASADSTYKALGAAGARKYDADNAITRGGGYWCSEANIQPEREVTWTAELRGPRVLTGVSILWVYAPQFVSISAKREKNDKFVEVVPYQSVDATGGSLVIPFRNEVQAKYVKIAMKGQIHGYFGIEFVQFRGQPNLVFRIQSGITSIEDMCLQVDETNEVVLESCISAIASFKFNDIWKYNDKRQLYSPVSNLCMTLEDGVDAEGGRVVMLPCNSKSGSNSWDLLPNNQIKLRRPGDLCLSQEGSYAGLGNVALNKIASSNLSRKNDSRFNAERAIDGNLESYWGSEPFTLQTIPERVEFIVNLQEYYKVRKVEIEWEAPALVYEIYARKDDEDWELLKKVRANTLKKTVDDLHNKVIRFIKLDLIRPNPEYLSYSGQIFYGIRNFAVFSNRLKTVVEPCGRAKLTKDARDKYFMESIYEVDIHSGEPLMAAEKAIETLVGSMERKIAHIENLNHKMQQCKLKHVNALKGVQNLDRSFERISNEVYKLEMKLGLKGEYKPDDQDPSDCIEIKNRGENNPSGFYYIHPPCSKRKLRVYCDMYTGSSYYVVPLQSGMISLPDAYTTCREHGLEPLHIRHEMQIEALKIMLKTMDIASDQLYPIAVRVGQKFKSLDLEEDVTWALNHKADKENNIVAIGIEGTQYVDGRKTDFSGIMCSTNFSSVSPPPQVIKLGCHTLLQENGELKETPMGKETTVSCPKNCVYTYDEDVDVEGGNNGLYSLKTPICIAAIHAGEYSKNAILAVQKLDAPVEFEGVFQNGIQSTSCPSLVGDIAFKVTRRREECTPKKVQPLVDRGATAGEDKGSQIDIQQLQNSSLSHGISLLNQQGALDPATGEAIGQLVNEVNQQTGKSSPAFLDMFHHHFTETLSGAIQLIKTAEMKRKPIEEILDRLDDGIASLQQKLQWLAARITYKKGPLLEGIKQLQREAAVQNSFEPYSIHDVTSSNLFDRFHSATVGNVQGTPKWTVSSLSLQGAPETVISQTSEFTAHGQVSGALLYLASANYYDFIYSASVFAGGSGTFGLAFRILDEHNFYLFQMVQMNGGYKRLIRVVNGEAFEIAKIEDGGFIDGVLYTVRIEARQCRISISTIQGLDPVFEVPERAIDIVDCNHASGSIGLYSGQINLVHFARVYVETLPCIRYDMPPLPPKPPICSIYKESFSVGFGTNWRVLDNSGTWRFENDIGGEARVISHRACQNIDGTVEPSIIVLKGGRSCKAGIFRVSMFPQCDPSGLMGLMVHFIDSGNYVSFECSSRSCRIVQMHKGNRTLLEETSLKGLTIASWNVVEVIFKRDALSVSLGDPEMQSVFINTAFAEDLQETGTVGLYSIGCAGCAFSNISLLPNYAAVSRTSTGDKRKTQKSVHEDQCTAIDRLAHCQEISPDNVANCEAKYCSFCCEKKNKDEPAAQDVCYKRCKALDHSAVLLQKTVDHFWRGCAPILNRNEKEQPEANQEEYTVQDIDRIGDCELCCQSSVFVDHVSSHINRAAQARCLKLCSSEFTECMEIAHI